MHRLTVTLDIYLMSSNTELCSLQNRWLNNFEGKNLKQRPHKRKCGAIRSHTWLGPKSNTFPCNVQDPPKYKQNHTRLHYDSLFNFSPCLEWLIRSHKKTVTADETSLSRKQPNKTKWKLTSMKAFKTAKLSSLQVCEHQSQRLNCSLE